MLEITKINNLFQISIKSESNKSQYAIYVNLNGKKISTVWYQDEPNFEITAIDDGEYTFEVFIKDELGNITTYISNSYANYKLIEEPETLPAELFEKKSFFIKKTKDSELHCFFNKGMDESSLFVLLTGAVNKTEPNYYYPKFDRWSWGEKFPGSILCIADPTLNFSDDLNLGWYVGSKSKKIDDAIEKLTLEIVKLLYIPPNRVITYGSSGGGFAAISLALKLDSIAVAINPQTNIFQYEKSSVDKFLNTYFKSQSSTEVEDQDRKRLDLTYAYKFKENNLNIIYVQNSLDTFHYDRHFLPFSKILKFEKQYGKSEDGKHYLISYTNENGHGPEPEYLFARIVSKAIEFRLNKC